MELSRSLPGTRPSPVASGGGKPIPHSTRDASLSEGRRPESPSLVVVQPRSQSPTVPNQAQPFLSVPTNSRRCFNSTSSTLLNADASTSRVSSQRPHDAEGSDAGSSYRTAQASPPTPTGISFPSLSRSGSPTKDRSHPTDSQNPPPSPDPSLSLPNIEVTSPGHSSVVPTAEPSRPSPAGRNSETPTVYNITYYGSNIVIVNGSPEGLQQNQYGTNFLSTSGPQSPPHEPADPSSPLASEAAGRQTNADNTGGTSQSHVEDGPQPDSPGKWKRVKRLFRWFLQCFDPCLILDG